MGVHLCPARFLGLIPSYLWMERVPVQKVGETWYQYKEISFGGGGDRSQHRAGKGAVRPVSKEDGRMVWDPQTRAMGASRGDG